MVIKDLEALADNRYFTMRETAAITGYQVRTIRYFLYNKQLKGVKHKNRWIFSGKEIKRFMNDYKNTKYSKRIKTG